MKENHGRFLMMIIAGAVLGALLGIFFPQVAQHTDFLGTLFLNALKMMVLPLIITSMIVGVTSLGNVRRLGSLGLKTFLYYFVTTAIAVLVGIVLVVIIEPGAGFDHLTAGAPVGDMTGKHLSVKALVLSLISPNLVQAASEFQILPLIIASIFFGVAITALGPKGEGLISIFSALNEAVMKVVYGIVFFTPLGVFALIASRLGSMGGGRRHL